MALQSAPQTGFAVVQASDGTVTVVRASKRDRIRSKLLMAMQLRKREVPCLKLNKGDQIPDFVHEPNDDVLGGQLLISLQRIAANSVREIILCGVYVDRDPVDPNRANVSVRFRYADDQSVEDRLDVPLSMWGVV